MNSRYNYIALAAAVLAVCAIAPASAQPTAGSSEITGAASFFRPIGGRGGTFNLDGSYGYYLDNPALEVGFRQSYNLNYSRDEGDVWNAVTAPYFNYNFLDPTAPQSRRNSIVPYVGGFVGAVWNDQDFTGTTGPQVGAKFYVTPSSFISTNYRYEWFFDEVKNANEVTDANHIVTLGVGFNWGGAGAGR